MRAISRSEFFKLVVLAASSTATSVLVGCSNDEDAKRREREAAEATVQRAREAAEESARIREAREAYQEAYQAWEDAGSPDF